MFFLTPNLEFLAFLCSKVDHQSQLLFFLTNRDNAKFPSITYREIKRIPKTCPSTSGVAFLQESVNIAALYAEDLNYIVCCTDSSSH